MKHFTGEHEAKAYFDSLGRTNALARRVHDGWLIFRNATDAIGHPSGHPIEQGTLR